jgi:hypothetical protein
MKTVRIGWLAVTLLAFGGAGCGGDETPGPQDGSAALAPAPPQADRPAPAVQEVAGVYALDFARTSGGKVVGVDGQEVPVSPDVLARVQANHGPENFRLELKADGSFELVLSQGLEDFKTGGLWRPVAGGVELTTTMINGERPPPDMPVTETYEREDGYLVTANGDQRVYLRRQP